MKIPAMQNSLLPLQEAFARQLAQEWIEAWNSHDLERILAHYDDEVTLVSPVALRLLNNGNGVVEGKVGLRDYFRRGLEAYPNMRFDLIETFWGIETVVLYYSSNFRDSKTAEVMQINSTGKVCQVWANYDQ